jgi:hypothetical protein
MIIYVKYVLRQGEHLKFQFLAALITKEATTKSFQQILLMTAVLVFLGNTIKNKRI